MPEVVDALREGGSDSFDIIARLSHGDDVPDSPDTLGDVTARRTRSCSLSGSARRRDGRVDGEDPVSTPASIYAASKVLEVEPIRNMPVGTSANPGKAMSIRPGRTSSCPEAEREFVREMRGPGPHAQPNSGNLPPLLRTPLDRAG